ncbi:MAG TPA: TadE family protein [Nitrospiria bacterium]|nr:TadE family protein [Nitrospiria bacterium]
MTGFLIGGSVLLLLLMGIIQLSLLWAGQGAVETAAHFAARKFALHARDDYRKAKTVALAEASSLCLHRPGGKWGSAKLTSIDFSRRGTGDPSRPALPGEAHRLRITHWIELFVPWVNRILFVLAPVKKARIGDRYFLLLQSSRWVTVE